MPLSSPLVGCRFLIVVILICFISINKVQAHALEKSRLQVSEEPNHLEGSLQQNHPLRQEVYGSIVPIVHSSGSESKKNASGLPKAEVRVLLGHKDPNPDTDGLIRASSILMEYDEDTRQFLTPEGHDSKHRIRHRSRKNLRVNPSNGDNRTANDAPLTGEPAKEQLLTSSIRHRAKSRESAKDTVYDRDKQKQWKTPSYKSISPRNDTWIALHSPIHIYIPVRQGRNVSSSNPADSRCVRCAPNLVVTAHPGETEAEVPIPAISICPRLARQRGRINVAVTAGPQPGYLVSGGQYPVELLIWKSGSQVFSCRYTLKVIVETCREILSPDNGTVECSKSTGLGSQCKFSCFSGYILQGFGMVTCKEISGKVSWSAPFPVCKKTESKTFPVAKRLPCLKPKQPGDGTVVCDSSGKTIYSDGSVCQFFCYPGFVIETLLTTSALTVCKNGQWTPNKKVSCIATYCSEPPSPIHGSVRCDNYVKDSSFKSEYQNGTSCHVQCDPGYTISKSQQSLNGITCNAPNWIHSSNLECKRLIIPQNHPKDCKNVTEVANRKGFAKIKPPRFFLNNVLPQNKGEKFVYGNCTYSGKIGIGNYVNNCSVRNEDLDVSGFCSYFIIVRENSCPSPPDVPNSKFECKNKSISSYPKKTICKYVCNPGFMVPLRERKLIKKTCSPKLEWQPSAMPSCLRAVPPSPRKGSCTSQTLVTSANAPMKIKKAKFKSSLAGGKVKVKCSLNNPLPPGNYVNECQARDKKLGLIATCQYNISIIVSANACPALPTISTASIKCLNSTGEFSVGTICQYECDSGFIIPSDLLSTSVKICSADYVWNSTLVPDCVSQSAPIPEDSSCIDYSILVDDSESHEVIVPTFKSSNGTILDVECDPFVLRSYGKHKINCTAFDPQVKANGSCSFDVELQNPNNSTESEEDVCPSIQIENGVFECKIGKSKLYSPGTLCEFLCDDNYTIPNSQRNMSVILCLESTEWNVTYFPYCLKSDAPVLISGCVNYSISTLNIEEVCLSLPVYLTSQNTSAAVNCTPEIFQDYAEHEISCTAVDEELDTVAVCTYHLNISKDETGSSTDNSSATSDPTSAESLIPCKPLLQPNNTLLNCSNDGSIQFCEVECEEGYGWSSDYRSFKGYVECDGTDGIWDYQREYKIVELPDCLGHLRNTSVRVSLSFSATVDNCSAEFLGVYQNVTKSQLIGINRDICQEVDCDSSPAIYCLEVDLQNRTAIKVEWMLQMAFIPPPDDVVPEYEHNLEAILNTTRMTILSDEQFYDHLLSNNIEVQRDSFNRSLFVLACDEEGYGVDPRTDKCVQCRPNYREIDSECHPCPPRQFQLKPGQTECEMCEGHLFAFEPGPPGCTD